MRRFWLIFLLLLPAMEASAGERTDLSSLWDDANTLYINGDYGGAVVLYDSIVGQGYVSSKLYYNLGNAHFKSNNIGYAILNYNRALKISPYDRDIEYNLAVANSYIKDRIETVPTFFLSNWLRALRSQLSSNTWALISLLMLAAALGLVLVYVLAERKSLRKAGFFLSIVFAFFFVVSLIFSCVERREMLNSSEAVVITSAASVKSSPDRSSKDLFIIHEGTKVEVSESFNGWTEILLSDGNKGWIINQAIELID